MARRKRYRRRMPTWLIVLLVVAGIWLLGRVAQESYNISLPFKIPGINDFKAALGELYGYEDGTAKTPAPLLPQGGIPEKEKSFTMDMIDVGQGLAVLITAPGGERALIDSGDTGAGAALINSLNREGVKKLDYLILTHPHLDHVGSMQAVMEAFSVSRVLSGPVPEELTPTIYSYMAFLKTVAARGLKLEVPKAGDTLPLGEATIKIIGPIKQSKEDLNDNSLALRVSWGDVSYIITGDASFKSETDMADSLEDLRASVLVAGHHGSSDASSNRFLWAVNPKYVGISCKQSNDYGHPHESTLGRIGAVGAAVFRTDLDGSVKFTSHDKKTVSATTEKEDS